MRKGGCVHRNEVYPGCTLWGTTAAMLEPQWLGSEAMTQKASSATFHTRKVERTTRTSDHGWSRRKDKATSLATWQPQRTCMESGTSTAASDKTSLPGGHTANLTLSWQFDYAVTWRNIVPLQHARVDHNLGKAGTNAPHSMENSSWLAGAQWFSPYGAPRPRSEGRWCCTHALHVADQSQIFLIR